MKYLLRNLDLTNFIVDIEEDLKALEILIDDFLDLRLEMNKLHFKNLKYQHLTVMYN
jgi:hypothetical protein